MLTKKIKKFIACPNCLSNLKLNQNNLECKKCKKKFMIKEDIPILIADTKEYLRKETKKVKEFWDKNPEGCQWSSIDEEIKTRYDKQRWILDIIDEKLFKEKDTLEIGSGQGKDLSILCKRGTYVFGTDISFNSLLNAKKKIKYYNFKKADLAVADAHHLPVKNNSFDIVYSWGVLHHICDTQKGIDEVYRILKKNGIAVIKLYRKYTIQQIIVSILRGINKGFIFITNDKEFLIRNIYRLFRFGKKNKKYGTSIQEIFLCDILKTYSTKQAKKMFNKFSNVKFKYYQVGFSRIADFIKMRFGLKEFLFKLDNKLSRLNGFFMVIYAEK